MIVLYSILDSIAKVTSCFHYFSHGATLHRHSFSCMIFNPRAVIVLSLFVGRSVSRSVCRSVCVCVCPQFFSAALAAMIVKYGHCSNHCLPSVQQES